MVYMNYNVKCAICGTKFFGGMYEDSCPNCDWLYTGEEKEMNPDTPCDFNKISINQAKLNFKNGLDIWGKPLKQRT